MFMSFCLIVLCLFFFFKQKTAYEMRISDWSSDVCSSDLAGALCAEFGRAVVTDALRVALDVVRAQIGVGALAAVPEAPQFIVLAAQGLARRRQRALRRTINASGIVLHTNLGRAPLAVEAIAAVKDVASGYCNLEFDLDSGRRGSRTSAVEPLLRVLSSGESALAVNNGAAALLAELGPLDSGGAVIVSRGELVEIGGGFRIPAVIRQGGARLVEEIGGAT